MTITNHLIAGSLIGLSVKQPEIAIVLAYLSHFVMDALPHYGYPGTDNFADAVKESLKHKAAQIFVVFSTLSFIAVLVFLLAKHRYFVIIVGLVAVLPDAFHPLNYYFFERKHKLMKGFIGWVNIKFHGKIQLERPWGIFVEYAAFLFLAYLLYIRV